LKPTATATAKEALEFLNTAFDMEKKKGRGLKKEEDEVRRYILKEYPTLGRAPTVQEIARGLGMGEEKVRVLLKKLDEQDVLYLDPKSGEIAGAYPFKEESPHEVRMENKKVYAMCAVDALGAPFMFDGNAEVKSVCSYCGRDIMVKIEGGGMVSQAPERPVVWIGKKCASHAATSVCTTLSFFCSREHAGEWRSEHGEDGWVLSLGEALFIGKSLFEEQLK
jgi:DNA-binding Lrp family transcriptional regulator